MFRPINIRTFTFFLSLWAGLQGTLQLGFVRLNLISLEHRFSFTTSQLAYILASYDVASVFFLLPLTYMTARSRVDKSRLFPLGLILMGVGALILCIPQFLTPPVTITNSNNDTDLCIIGHEPPNLRVVEPAPSRRVIVGIFVLGQALIGIGSTPLYTLAVTWIDENIPKRNSALYVGFFFTSTILGPAVGYIVGGYVLDHLHTDFLTQKMPLNIDSSSKAWIGAWWLLFMGIADISIVLGIVVFFYPKDLTRKEPAEMYNTQEQGDGKTPLRVMLKSLMQNPIFTGLSLVSICEAYILSSFNSFMSKYVQNQFGLSTEGSSIIMGCLIVPAGFLGIISGGYVIKRYQLSTFQLLVLIQTCLTLSLVFSAGFILVNDPVQFAGINKPYRKDSGLNTRTINNAASHNLTSLFSECNSHCGCDPALYNPICGADLITYYNPCFAGCHFKGVSKEGINIYYDCPCVQVNGSEDVNVQNKADTRNLYRELLNSLDIGKLYTKSNAIESFNKVIDIEEIRNILTTTGNIDNVTDVNNIEEIKEILRELFGTEYQTLIDSNRINKSNSIQAKPNNECTMNRENTKSNRLELIETENLRELPERKLLKTTKTLVEDHILQIINAIRDKGVHPQTQKPSMSTAIPSRSPEHVHPPIQETSMSTAIPSRSPEDVHPTTQETSMSTAIPSRSPEDVHLQTQETSMSTEIPSRSPEDVHPTTQKTSMSTEITSIRPQDKVHTPNPAIKPAEIPSIRLQDKVHTPTPAIKPAEIPSIRPQDKVHTPTPAIKPEVNYKIQAYGKACPNTSAHVILFSIGCFFSFYFQFLCLMPATEGILRSVDSTYKSFALAIQWLSTRTLAMLPGPTILALFIDSSCLYWRPGETYCILYDNYYFSRNLATYGFYFRHLSIYILFYMMFNEKVIL